LTNPVVNKYLSDPKELKSMKVDRVGDKKNPGHPKLIPIEKDDHELWFKQDDSFE